MRLYAERTDVPVDRSKAEVERMLRAAGANEVAFLMQVERALVAFKIAGRGYRFDVPLTSTNARSGRDVSPEQRARQRWRALVLILKAKLESGRSGITSLEVELLPYAMLPGGRTVAQDILPRLAKAQADGRDYPLLPGSQ